MANEQVKTEETVDLLSLTFDEKKKAIDDNHSRKALLVFLQDPDVNVRLYLLEKKIFRDRLCEDSDSQVLQGLIDSDWNLIRITRSSNKEMADKARQKLIEQGTFIKKFIVDLKIVTDPTIDREELEDKDENLRDELVENLTEKLGIEVHNIDHLLFFDIPFQYNQNEKYEDCRYSIVGETGYYWTRDVSLEDAHEMVEEYVAVLGV